MLRYAPILFLLLAAACGAPKGVKIEETPAWRTPEGARTLKLELLRSLVDQGATSESMTLIRKLREEGETSPLLDLYQGMSLAQEGFHGEAARILEGYLKRQPRDTTAIKALALIQADTGETAQAIALLRQAVATDKGDAEAWNNLGFLLLSERAYPEALTALQQAVALDGTRSRYRNNLGFALAANDRWRQAFEAFQSGGPIDEAHYNLAVAYELQDQAEPALRHYRKAVEYNPNHKPSLDAITRLVEAAAEAP